MYLSTKASRIRQLEAQRARNNRAEIVKVRSLGQVTRRELIKWGIFTTGGVLVCKNGLSPFARSAYAAVPTGTPRSPLFGVQKFTQPMPRLRLQSPTAMMTRADGDCDYSAKFNYPTAKRLSYHTDFTNYSGQGANPYLNPITHRDPMEGRPPGEIFAHQRWAEFTPKVGYVMSLAPCAPGTKFHPLFPDQQPNSVWCYGTGDTFAGEMPPWLIKGRYGEPICTRIYNHTPVSRADNNGFGRNETQLHFHNAHNGAESDGATGAHHFPGTFYDYRWSTTLARRDKINTQATDRRASGPNGNGGLVNVPGDWREIQGTMWAHDHRFFFTAENVYKGNLGMVNYYSGPDRGNETLVDGVNLRLPSGRLLDYGNVDFDVNLVISDAALRPDGQLFFDTFTTDGFLGDLPLVNFAYAPFLNVLPRKYRFRILNACMSRFFQFAIAAPNGSAVPFKFIANDGNFVVNPITLTSLVPIVQPVRARLVEFGRSGSGDSRGPNGQCTPDCPEGMPFPWTIKINGQEAHSMNANRISLLIPQPGQIEHWTYVNGGGG